MSVATHVAYPFIPSVRSFSHLQGSRPWQQTPPVYATAAARHWCGRKYRFRNGAHETEWDTTASEAGMMARGVVPTRLESSIEGGAGERCVHLPKQALRATAAELPFRDLREPREGKFRRRCRGVVWRLRNA